MTTEEGEGEERAEARATRDARSATAEGFGANSRASSRRRMKKLKVLAHMKTTSAHLTPGRRQSPSFANADARDDCETPFRAYKDAEPFLFALARKMKKEKKELKIYDPYYCAGSVKSHLRALGFERVYNENEDFYAKIAARETPEFDVLVTNPPYSGDHFVKILEFCRDSRKPWMLLLPNFVCRKSYYAPSIGADAKPLFLIPSATKPYRYWAPGRQGFETRAKGTTPFETFWYMNFCGILDAEETRAWWIKKYKAHSTCDIPALDEALPQQQRLQKRPNPKVRALLASKGVKTTTTTSGVYFDPERAAKKRKLVSRE